MFSYFAFGLQISSELVIPEFIETEPAESSLQIKLERSQTVGGLLPADLLANAASIQLTRSKAIVYVRGTAAYVIEHGTKVTIIPDGQPSELLIRFYLIGTIMGIVLYQRHCLVLHASAVNINGGAVVFLGVSGEGKSSIAATFVTYGHRLITDDVAPIDLTKEATTICPGFPQVKVGVEIAEALGYEYDRLHAVHTFKNKRALQPRQDFTLEPVPIKRIYVLTTSDKFEISPIRASEAVTELARHSRPTTLYHSGDAAHFFQCANLVKQQPVYRLHRPKNIDLLPELVKLVEQDSI